MSARGVFLVVIILLIIVSIALWVLLTPPATDIPTPTEAPTNTPIPTSTPTEAPTNTPIPTPIPTTTGLLQVTFIDVGQGDAAWLKTPDNWDILIDGGPRSEGAGVVSYLQDHGVTDIEVLVLSHPHEDHVGGLVTVLERMEVDQALTNCQPYSSPIYESFQDLLTNNEIPTTCVREGDNFAWGSSISATVVNPPDPLPTGPDPINNNSVVLRISYGTIDFLFTGDIESEAEAEIVGRSRTIEAEILKVAHHGSRSSSTVLFLAPVDPEVAVISVGASNRYGHPHSETLTRLSNAGVTIYRTDLHGTIVIATDGTTYSVQREASSSAPSHERLTATPTTSAAFLGSQWRLSDPHSAEAAIWLRLSEAMP